MRGGALRECPDCGLFQLVPDLPRRATARCQRCHAMLRRQRTDPQGRSLALVATGVLLFALATQLPFMSLQLEGRDHATWLFSGPEELEQQGVWALSVAVLVTTFAAPLAKLLAIGWVLIGVRLPRPPRHLHVVFRWVERLSAWSMIEVFLLGLCVAYGKLADLAQVQVGPAVYALAGLMLAMAATDAMLDHDDVWETLQRRGLTAAPVRPPDPAAGLIGCDCCGLVTAPGRSCPRCGGALRHRKPDSIARSWALLIAAAVLYIPANLLPVLTLIEFGRGGAQTILSGVESLLTAGMWPLAALVFFASVTVPVLKLLGLSLLLLSTSAAARRRLHERTVLFRIVDSIGRWSMIDVFMVSILTALVRLGAIASVDPGPGAVSFCAVVVLTMLSAMAFDPRLMWDAALRVPPPGASR